MAAAPPIEHCILLVRSHKVMLDSHLAMLYGVETRALTQAVKRNPDRFPEDFMFQLTWEEAASLGSQFVISSDAEHRLRSQSVILDDGDALTLKAQSVISKRGRHLKYRPYAFTEQGVAMLSSVLRSPRAIQVNVEIMRTFVRLRGILAGHKELAQKLNSLEKKYDSQFAVVFRAIRQLMAPPPDEPKGRIGFQKRTKDEAVE